MASGILLDRRVLTAYKVPGNVSTQGALDLRLLTEAWNTIQKSYVDRTAIQPEQLTYGAISGMIDALGDTGHSRFLTPDMLKAENNFTLFLILASMGKRGSDSSPQGTSTE